MSESIQLEDNPFWYRNAVIYQLHIKAFADSDGNGIGDFRGLIGKLDYLPEPRHHRRLGSPILSLTPSGRWLRHFRLLRRQPQLQLP